MWEVGSHLHLSHCSQYDALLRRTNQTLLNGSTVLARTAYGYDSASRLLNVSDGTNSATYSYLANSPMVSQIAFTRNGTNRMTSTKEYDLMNRLTRIASAPVRSGNNLTGGNGGNRESSLCYLRFLL